MITVSKEDYLKSILEAESEGETVISARCCRRRDCSVLRDVVDAIESSRLEDQREYR